MLKLLSWAGVWVGLTVSGSTLATSLSTTADNITLESTAVPAVKTISKADHKISFFENKLKSHPTLFNGHAALASAYLDKARETHDVQWIKKAKQSIDRSLEIQPNLNAFINMASLCNFSHRFQCALDNAERAAKTNPLDPRLITIKFEALLGLGQLEQAEALLNRKSKLRTDDITLSALRGRWFAEQERFDEAHEAFVKAASEANDKGFANMATWAYTNAAGMLLDSDRADQALQFLDIATALPATKSPIKHVLRIHWAEYYQLKGDYAKALQEYENLLENQADPELYRRAFNLAKKLNNEKKAQALFLAGEQAAEVISKEGEIFSIETQVMLYGDANTKLEKAQELALKNLEYKQDRAAKEALEYIQSLSANEANNSQS